MLSRKLYGSRIGFVVGAIMCALLLATSAPSGATSGSTLSAIQVTAGPMGVARVTLIFPGGVPAGWRITDRDAAAPTLVLPDCILARPIGPVISGVYGLKNLSVRFSDDSISVV